MSGTRDMDYPKLTKYGFLLGVSMLAVGVGGHVVGPALVGELPAWEATLFLDLEIGGILIGLLSPLTFGVVLPLTE